MAPISIIANTPLDDVATNDDTLDGGERPEHAGTRNPREHRAVPDDRHGRLREQGSQPDARARRGERPHAHGGDGPDRHPRAAARRGAPRRRHVDARRRHRVGPPAQGPSRKSANSSQGSTAPRRSTRPATPGTRGSAWRSPTGASRAPSPRWPPPATSPPWGCRCAPAEWRGHRVHEHARVLEAALPFRGQQDLEGSHPIELPLHLVGAHDGRHQQGRAVDRLRPGARGAAAAHGGPSLLVP